MRTVFLSAGELSGDLHGAAVARELRRQWPDVQLFGLGGPRMAEAGVELLADLDRLGVMGFAEVIQHLPYFARLLQRLRRELEARGAELLLLIDYPGFNLRLARLARDRAIPVLYYIAPQVWAWHEGRVKQLAERADRMALVLPFEEPLFQAAGARAEFVGHPLLDLPPVESSREEFCRRVGLDPGRPILALFPGSRAQELNRHLHLFLETARRIGLRRAEVQPVIAQSPVLSPAAYLGAGYPRVLNARELLAHSDAALVKSGTTTLEAALAGVPMVIAYRAHPATLWLARRLVKVPHIGLVNLVAGERLVPELVQEQATPAALSDAVISLLRAESSTRRSVIEGLGRVRAALAYPHADNAGTAARRVTRMAAELLAGAA
ncbi:MAG: lipid-A-disaccharide synthase [Gemmatimonadetes bacterium]|nr:lipid-A-disaccharide synthase [Gemmatimonadota bacterium]